MATCWQKHIQHEVVLLNLVTREIVATKNLQGQKYAR